MKSINFLLILILGMFFTTCKKEDRNCVKADFIGDYLSGTICKDINGASGQSISTMVRITDRTAENELNIAVDGIEITVVIDGCNFSGSDVSADVELNLTGSLSGDNIKVNLSGRAFGAFINCETKGGRN